MLVGLVILVPSCDMELVPCFFLVLIVLLICTENHGGRLELLNETFNLNVAVDIMTYMK